MKLCELLSGVKIISTNADMQKEINKIAFNSKKVKAKDVFVALEGKVDGHKFIDEAIRKKAAAVICQKPSLIENFVQVDNTRKALALMAANFYHNKHRQLKIISVTGTNGKTTTTYIINAILKANKHKTAIIGTLGAVIDNKKINTDLTTPDPLELHKLFLDAYEKGVEYVIMEASAHAIFYEKLYGIKSICVFTNISQDHLDFFKTMKSYAKTKVDYFNSQNVNIAVVNADDKYGREIIQNTKGYVLSYGINNPSDVFAMDIRQVKGKTQFIVNAFDEVYEISVNLLGKFNVYNTLSAIAVAKTLKVPMSVTCQALSSLKEIEGRFNIINSDITVIIDYAHTPDGLVNVLRAAKEVEGNRLITVFGCGGDRDKSKRAVMGRVAGAMSDYCVITSDNPRFENPNNIIKDIEKGLSEVSKDYICISDRAKAIAYSIKNAKKGDKIVIAGKGGENYIDIMGVKLEYSDKKACKSALRSYR